MSVGATQYTFQLMTELAAFYQDTGLLAFRLRDIQEGNWVNEEEPVFASGLNGARIDASARNKMSRISATNGRIVEGLLAQQVGGTIKSEAKAIPNFLDVIEITAEGGTTATVHYKPQGAVGAEIDCIYKVTSDGSHGESYLQGASASATQFSYNAATGAITLPTGVFAEGDTVIAQYTMKANSAKTLANDADSYNKNYYIVAKIWARSSCDGKSYPALIIFKNARISGNFDMTFGGEFAVHNFEAEAMVSCGSQNLWEFVVYDDEEVEEIS